MYIGAGLNWSRDIINDRATSELWINMRARSSEIPLASAKLRETVFPHSAETDFDFQSLGNILFRGRFELGRVSMEKVPENFSKSATI